MTCCPHCKGTTGYTVKVRAFGYALHEGAWDGKSEWIMDDSGITRVADKTVKCLDCGKRTLMKRLRET